MVTITRALVRLAPLAAALGLGGCYSGLESGNGPGAEGGADGADGADGSDDDDDDDADDDDDDDGPGADGEDPGRVTLHRLNRAEYNNTVRDLFWGLDITPADVFPADDHSLGFDNIADVLSVTPVLFELYERAAEQTLDAALTANISGEVVHVEAEDAGGSTGSVCCGGFWNLSSNGTVSTTVDLPGDGDYLVTVQAAEQAAGPDAANMRVLVDGTEIGNFDVTGTAAMPGQYEAEVNLTAGNHLVVVEFTNDFYDPDMSLDRNLLVDFIDVAGQGEGGMVSIRDQLLLCDPVVDGEAACARDVLEAFAPRAWRRPTTTAEVDALTAVYNDVIAEGGTWEEAVRVALKAVMISPHFIFRVEIDPDPTSLVAHTLSDYEVASRLSYFLWSSMPDETLFDLAAAGELSDPDVLQAQVARMLEDGKAEALVANFFGQWLWVRALNDALSKDYELYPDFSEALQASMQMETTLFLRTFLTEGRSMADLLTAEETFVDAALADLYGLPAPDPAAVDENGFARVPFNGLPRRGMLTQPGLMSVLAHPNVTSPVRRGKWVLEQLLCQPPPPPPPGVEIPEIEPTEGGTMREQLEQHRADPTCAACHDLMDPLGLALENWDAIGAYRELESGLPIDPSGNLPDGTPFADGLEMAGLIAESDDFARCTIRKTMTYALGRDIGVADATFVEAVEADFMAGNMTMEALLVAIVTNETFTMRRGEEE